MRERKGGRESTEWEAEDRKREKKGTCTYMYMYVHVRGREGGREGGREEGTCTYMHMYTYRGGLQCLTDLFTCLCSVCSPSGCGHLTLLPMSGSTCSELELGHAEGKRKSNRIHNVRSSYMYVHVYVTCTCTYCNMHEHVHVYTYMYMYTCEVCLTSDQAGQCLLSLATAAPLVVSSEQHFSEVHMYMYVHVHGRRRRRRRRRRMGGEVLLVEIYLHNKRS